MDRQVCPKRGRFEVLETGAEYASRVHGRTPSGLCSPGRLLVLREQGKLVSKANVCLAKAKHTHGWKKRKVAPYLEVVDVDIKTCVGFVYQYNHRTFALVITSTNAIFDRINEFLIRFAQDAILRVYIAQTIFCFLAGDLSALLVPFPVLTYSGNAGKCS